MKFPDHAGGWPAIRYTIRKAVDAGFLRFWRRMLSKNTCKTCAYGMGGQMGGMRNESGAFPEFCKKSVQAMAADMQPPIDRTFFASHSLEELAKLTSRELEDLGRLSYPILLRSGQTHFEPVDWNRALEMTTAAMRAVEPDRSFFYSSGRSSNEAAFLLQLLARVYGTNNVHNCSYYCHQASGVGLGRSIGSGTATVTLEDLHHADFVMLIGANPASNHPRLMTELAELRKRGGKVIVVNPMRELGLERFRIPSRPGSLLSGSQISDVYLQPRIGGDIALMKGMLKVLIELDAIDLAYISSFTIGFEELKEEVSAIPLEQFGRESGVAVEEIERVAGLYAESSGAIFMWAMGITHHEHGCDNVSMIANLALARGMVGRVGAGLMPIRGHSNVQGIGSVGFTPQLKGAFLDSLTEIYGLRMPEADGLDSMACVDAAGRGEIDFALYLGGNFYASNPDLRYAADSLSRIRSSVHISTKLNQGHVVVRPPEDGFVLILPTMTRDEELQSTTQESMFNYVRISDGGMKAPRGELKTETDIVTSIAGRLLPSEPIDFLEMKNHEDIRRVMARVVPGYDGLAKVDGDRQEFYVGGRTRHQPEFGTEDGKAHFIAVRSPLDQPSESLRLMTIRSEGQFNTVVYEEEDLYRGQDRRDVILLNRVDMERLGLQENDPVTVRSTTDAMRAIRAREYDIAPGCAAMYYPEANALVPTVVDSDSRTPAYKNVPITVAREAATAG